MVKEKIGPGRGPDRRRGLPDAKQMPQCKACQRQGCSHFRRGFAQILLHNNKDAGHPTIESCKPCSSEGICESDILVPATCPCHGCYDLIVRVDLNRGADDSLQYTLDASTHEWQVEVAKYRYKRDTELVIGCSGRHAIIESPKAGRYAQLWCRTCCNCEQTGKKVGRLAGCVDAAHWYTITNRSYHEKTPFHQLVNTLLVASYNDAIANRVGFEDALGSVGLSYYGHFLTMSKEAAANAAAAAAEAAGAEREAGGGRAGGGRAERGAGSGKLSTVTPPFHHTTATLPPPSLPPPSLSDTASEGLKRPRPTEAEGAGVGGFGAMFGQHSPVAGALLPMPAMRPLDFAEQERRVKAQRGEVPGRLLHIGETPEEGGRAEPGPWGWPGVAGLGALGGLGGLGSGPMGGGGDTQRGLGASAFLAQAREGAGAMGRRSELWDLPDILTGGGRGGKSGGPGGGA